MVTVVAAVPGFVITPVPDNFDQVPVELATRLTEVSQIVWSEPALACKELPTVIVIALDRTETGEAQLSSEVKFN